MDLNNIEKRYANDDITVIWQPGKCIHSTICWRGLSTVFDPRKKPWVDISGAESEAIMKQVDRCPSGALSYIKNETKGQATHLDTEVDTIVETMKNGPLMVYGNITVRDHKGHEEKKNRVTAFCRCGQSNNKPFCDGSHVRVGFKDDI